MKNITTSSELVSSFILYLTQKKYLYITSRSQTYLKRHRTMESVSSYQSLGCGLKAWKQHPLPTAYVSSITLIFIH